MKYCLKIENSCLKLQTKHPQNFSFSYRFPLFFSFFFFTFFWQNFWSFFALNQHQAMVVNIPHITILAFLYLIRRGEKRKSEESTIHSRPYFTVSPNIVDRKIYHYFMMCEVLGKWGERNYSIMRVSNW